VNTLWLSVPMDNTHAAELVQAARTAIAPFAGHRAPQFRKDKILEQLRTLIGDGNEKPSPTTIIMSPQNDYLKEFSGR